MSRYYKQMQHGNGEARRLLDERLARKEMGEKTYEKMVSNNEDRAFKIFGVVFIVMLAVTVLVVTAMDY